MTSGATTGTGPEPGPDPDWTGYLDALETATAEAAALASGRIDAGAPVPAGTNGPA